MRTKILLLFLLGWVGMAFGQGCFLGNNPTSVENLTKFSGNQQFDNINNQEYELLSSVFGVRPDFYYLHDFGMPNAYAAPTIHNPNLTDGTIMLGFSLVQQECSNSPSGTCSAVPFILAHEFAHILDFKFGTGLSGKYKELFADYIAGSYLYHRANRFGNLNIQEVASSFFSKGNYDFNNPNFHGTPQERYNCLSAGYVLAQQYSQQGIHLTRELLMNSAIQYVGQF